MRIFEEPLVNIRLIKENGRCSAVEDMKQIHDFAANGAISFATGILIARLSFSGIRRIESGSRKIAS